MNNTETEEYIRYVVVCVSLQSQVQCQMAYSVIPAVAPQTVCNTPALCVGLEDTCVVANGECLNDENIMSMC